MMRVSNSHLRLMEAEIDTSPAPFAGRDQEWTDLVYDLRDARAENARLQARITELEGRSGCCVECERLARKVEELEAAMCRIHEGCCRQLAEPRDHGNDQYCMTDCATVAEEALAAIAARKKEA
jgi:hypothetical protein